MAYHKEHLKVSYFIFLENTDGEFSHSLGHKQLFSYFELPIDFASCKWQQPTQEHLITDLSACLKHLSINCLSCSIGSSSSRFIILFMVG